MPTVLQITSVVGYTAVGKIAEQIGKAAIDMGWDSYIAYGRGIKGKSASHTFRIGSSIESNIHGLVSVLLDAQGLGSYYATKRLIKKIQEIKPNVVHIHNIHGHYLNYKVLFDYLNKTNIQVVLTLHDCWSMTGHCTHFVRTGCEKWRTECHHCEQKNYYPKTRLLDGSRRNFRLKQSSYGSCKNLHLVSASNWIKQFCNVSPILKNKDCRVIHNGIDLNVYRPVKTDQSSKFRLMGIANGWGVSKGLYDFYKLWESLDHDKYEITLVGVTPKIIKEMPKGIIGISRTDTVDKLVEIYSQSDALINPTYADTFPTVNLEALACGTPVITYITGGSPEAIDDQTGFVIEQGDIKGIIDAIHRIESNPISADVCRRRAELYFDKDNCFRQYVEYYNDIIK